MTAAEARAGGDATGEQRAELRALIAGKAVADSWVRRFYSDVRAAGGLTRGRASGALIYLRRLPDKTDQPTYATAELGEELRRLVRTRLVPGRIAQMLLLRLDAGELTYVEAQRAIADFQRMPLRSFVAPDPLRTVAGGEAPDGYYALTGTDGRVRRYRVHTLPATGQRLVDQITGDKHSQRRRLRGSIQATPVLRAIAADLPGAARLYGATFKRCSDCNQPLRDESQPGFPHGYGEDCWTARQEVAAASAAPAPAPADETPTEEN